jgi:sarcosine oxidase
VHWPRRDGVGPKGPHARRVRGRVTCSPIDRPGAIIGPARVTLCLQSTPRLSDTVVRLGLCHGCIRWDRSASGPVVVNLGGQRSPRFGHDLLICCSGCCPDQSLALLSGVLPRWRVSFRSADLLHARLGGVLDALVGIGHHNVQDLVHCLVRCGSLDEGEGQAPLRLWRFGYWLIILLFHIPIIDLRVLVLGQEALSVSRQAGALGRTRIPNLLIRRDIRQHLWPAGQALTCQDVAQQCAAVVGAWRHRKAKIRPAHIKPAVLLALDPLLVKSAPSVRHRIWPWETVPSRLQEVADIRPCCLQLPQPGNPSDCAGSDPPLISSGKTQRWHRLPRGLPPGHAQGGGKCIKVSVYHVNMNYTAEVAVIGAGVIGMSTTLALKDRGIKTICIEQASPGSGQSKGVVRNFRHYHADTNLIAYSRLARNAWKLWESRFDRVLLSEVGLVYLSSVGPHIAETLQNCEVPVTRDAGGGSIDGLPTQNLWNSTVVIDEKAGPIWARETIVALNSALPNDILNATVLALDVYQDRVKIATTEGIVRAEHVIVCAGVQTNRIALSAGISIDVIRAVHSRPCYRIRDEFKGSKFKSVVDTSEQYGPSIYGAPAPDGQGYVVGLAGVNDDTPIGAFSEYSVDLAAVNSDIRQINDYVQAAFSELESLPMAVRLCTTTAIPGDDGDAIACYTRDRLSFMVGNNLFKFAPLLGESLADVATGCGPEWLLRPT